jgi:predicted pyridoxine 5'-phosphate oxidase superfamily flavin-nucleotide-binding protein
VRDNKTVLIPDRRGNNRVDPAQPGARPAHLAAVHVPGISSTLRINGRAEITTEPEMCASFAMRNAPKSVLVVTAERVYFQCPWRWCGRVVGAMPRSPAPSCRARAGSCRR